MSKNGAENLNKCLDEEGWVAVRPIGSYGQN